MQLKSMDGGNREMNAEMILTHTLSRHQPSLICEESIEQENSFDDISDSSMQYTADMMVMSIENMDEVFDENDISIASHTDGKNIVFRSLAVITFCSWFPVHLMILSMTDALIQVDHEQLILYMFPIAITLPKFLVDLKQVIK